MTNETNLRNDSKRFPGRPRATYGRAMDFEEYRTYDATGLAELVATEKVSAAELLTWPGTAPPR